MAVQVKLFPTLQKLSKSQRETFHAGLARRLTPQDILTDKASTNATPRPSSP